MELKPMYLKSNYYWQTHIILWTNFCVISLEYLYVQLYQMDKNKSYSNRVIRIGPSLVKKKHWRKLARWMKGVVETVNREELRCAVFRWRHLSAPPRESPHPLFSLIFRTKIRYRILTVSFSFSLFGLHSLLAFVYIGQKRVWNWAPGLFWIVGPI